jgi:hypothetical protein
VLAGSADLVAQKLAGAKHLQLKRSLLLMVCLVMYFQSVFEMETWSLVCLLGR